MPYWWISGQTVSFAKPPKPEKIGIPFSYRAPEASFESRIDPASDVWSLACVLYEIRAGDPLFYSMLGGRDEIVEDMVALKGKLPDR